LKQTEDRQTRPSAACTPYNFNTHRTPNCNLRKFYIQQNRKEQKNQNKTNKLGI